MNNDGAAMEHEAMTFDTFFAKYEKRALDGAEEDAMSEASAEQAATDNDVEAKLRALTDRGRLHVRAQGKSFWILRKSWQNVLFYYAPSKDGKRASAPFVMMSADQLWNWLAHLEWVR